MSEKLRVYSISVMAFMSMDDALELSLITEADTNETAYIEHVPGILPAQSIQQAAEAVKIFALERWKVSEGWYGHQACILPITKDFYEKAFEAYEAGLIDTFNEPEPGECFTF